MRRLELTFPMPVNLANARLHWREKARRHQAWKMLAVVRERGLRGRHRPMQRLRVTAVLYHGGAVMDHDNAVARLKWCLDLLRERGLIVDDSPRHLTLTGIPEQRAGRPRRVVLTLEEEDA
jgi:hypothetical protein